MSDKFLAASSVTLLTAGSLLGASAANAVTAADCGTFDGATVTLLAGDVCDVVFDAAGEYTFEAPAGITALEAILVGGGMGSNVVDDFGQMTYELGYSGQVSHVVVEDATAAFDVVVGEGGTHGHTVSDLDGTVNVSDLTFATGTEISNPTEDYGVEPGSQYYTDGGFGAGFGIGPEDYSGLLTSEPVLVGEDNPLFPVIDGENELAVGGRYFQNDADCVDREPGSGANVCGDVYEDGYDGAAIFRFSIASLASTGVDATAIGIGAGALLAGGVALGAVAAVRRARVTN